VNGPLIVWRGMSGVGAIGQESAISSRVHALRPDDWTGAVLPLAGDDDPGSLGSSWSPCDDNPAAGVQMSKLGGFILGG
jgi:hypothetical protein